VIPTYDQARQYGKTYVGALNTGTDAYRALFAPGADIRVGGRPATLERVLQTTPPGRSAFRRARLEPPHVVLTVRVRDRVAERVDDLPHRLTLDDHGRIASLEA
jgi:hypothetical protein